MLSKFIVKVGKNCVACGACENRGNKSKKWYKICCRYKFVCWL